MNTAIDKGDLKGYPKGTFNEEVIPTTTKCKPGMSKTGITYDYEVIVNE